MSWFPLPHKWEHLMLALITAPRRLGHMPPATYWLPPATCQLHTVNFHLQIVSHQNFFYARIFFPLEWFCPLNKFLSTDLFLFCQQFFRQKYHSPRICFPQNFFLASRCNFFTWMTSLSIRCNYTNHSSPYKVVNEISYPVSKFSMIIFWFWKL